MPELADNVIGRVREASVSAVKIDLETLIKNIGLPEIDLADQLTEIDEVDEERAIDHILKTRQEEAHNEGESIFYLIHYGGKNMSVRYSSENNTFYTNIWCLDNPIKKRNETTLLYKAAKRLIQAVTNGLKKTVNYRYQTDSETMRNWSKDKGEKMLGMEEIKSDKFLYEAEATFEPSKI